MGKVSTFANRLKTLLAVRQITQAELARLTGISKSSVTHYVKGDWEGKQDAVYAIATAAGVNEAWLMGYDVPMDKSFTSPMVYCEDCGMNYNSSRREEILAHDARHNKWLAAVNKFGFCWPAISREKAKGDARGDIETRHLTLDEYIDAQIIIFKALFSRSLESSDYNLNHVNFDDYVAMLLNQSSWKKVIPLSVYTALTAKYGEKAGIPAGSYYAIPSRKTKTTVSSNASRTTRDGYPIHLSITDTDPQIDAILRNARKLNAQGLERLEAYSDDLAGNPKYLKQKAPLTIAARGGDVMDTSQIDIEALKRGLKELDAEDNP